MFYWDIQQVNYEYDRIPSGKTETWTIKDLIDDIVNFNTNVRKSSLSKILSVTLPDQLKPKISSQDFGQLKINFLFVMCCYGKVFAKKSNHTKILAYIEDRGL